MPFVATDTQTTGQSIKCAVIETFSLNAFFDSVKLSKFNDLKLPTTISKISSICRVRDALDSMNASKHQHTENSDLNSIWMLHVKQILSLLSQYKSSEFACSSVVCLIYHQLELLATKHNNYSSELLIFAFTFYNFSFHAYRFLRRSRKLILPYQSTIRKIPLANAMDPFYEQFVKTFL